MPPKRSEIKAPSYVKVEANKEGTSSVGVRHAQEPAEIYVAANMANRGKGDASFSRVVYCQK